MMARVGIIMSVIVHYVGVQGYCISRIVCTGDKMAGVLQMEFSDRKEMF